MNIELLKLPSKNELYPFEIEILLARLGSMFVKYSQNLLTISIGSLYSCSSFLIIEGEVLDLSLRFITSFNILQVPLVYYLKSASFFSP